MKETKKLEIATEKKRVAKKTFLRSKNFVSVVNKILRSKNFISAAKKKLFCVTKILLA